MQTFEEFFEKLTESPDQAPTLLLNGNEKIIVAMAQYVSQNIPESTFLKIVFEDGSMMIIMLDSKEIFYTDAPIGEIEEIKDEDIGSQEEITFAEKKYKLVNAHDYQFCIGLIYGTPFDIEGEVSFSDYMDESETEMLSLGIVQYSGERIDILLDKIEVQAVDIK